MDRLKSRPFSVWYWTSRVYIARKSLEAGLLLIQYAESRPGTQMILLSTRNDVKPTQTGDEVRRYVASGGNNLPTQVGMGNQFGCFFNLGVRSWIDLRLNIFLECACPLVVRGWNPILAGLGFLRQEYGHWNGDIKRNCTLGGLTSLVSVHGKFQNSWLYSYQWQWVKRKNWGTCFVPFASCVVDVWNDVGYSFGLHEKFWSWTVDHSRVDGIWWIVLLMVWFFDNDNLPVISVSLPCWSSDSSLISR